MLTLAMTFSVAVADERLTLEECRRMAIENNKQLQLSDMELEAAGLQRAAAQTRFFPRINAEGGYQRRNKQYQLFDQDKFLPVIPYEGIDQQTGQFDPGILQDPDLAPSVIVINPVTGEPVLDDEGNIVFQDYAWLPQEEGVVGQKDNYRMGVNLTQPIYAGGKIRSGYRMASAGERIASARNNMTKAGVIAQTDELFWQVNTMKEKVELADSYREMIDRLVEDLEDLYQEGIVTQNQVLEAKVRRNEVKLKQKQAQNGLRLSKMALAQTIGLPVISEFSVEALESAGISVDLSENMLDHAYTWRPELNMMDEAINVHEEKVNMARADMLPTVGLAGGYTYMNPNPYNGFRDEFGGDWQIGISINIPIYHFGEKRKHLARARNEAGQQRLEKEEIKEQIALQVYQSRYQLEESISELELTQLSLEQAAENLRMTEDLFSEGRAKTRDLLEAQALWQDANTAHIEARNQYRLAYTRLQKARGQLHRDQNINQDINQ